MALKERKVIDQTTVRRNGNIDIRYAMETYDDSITPKAEIPAIEAEYEIVKIPVDAIPAIKDVDGNIVQEAVKATTKEFKKLVKEGIPAVPAVIDVTDSRWHREVILSADKTPAEVQAFLENSKA